MPAISPSSGYDLVVIGGGAAGFFGAIQAAEMRNGLDIVIIEKSQRLLSKVKVSGGGRCNVTHHAFSPAALSSHYPRGQKALKKLFHHFNAKDTVAWFAHHGVVLKTEEDGRMFPETDSSQTIIDCFLQHAAKNQIEIRTGTEAVGITSARNGWLVETSRDVIHTQSVLLATGGYHKAEGYHWLTRLGLQIVNPIPSLFTFNDPTKSFANLMGVSVPMAEVKIAGSRFATHGAVLVTHWGLSGPAVIRLSAWAAEHLYKLNYVFTALVNWSGEPDEEVRSVCMRLKEEGSQKKIMANPLFGLPKRLWEHLCQRAGVAEAQAWADVSNKIINRLIEVVCACPFPIKGKTTFKEEFVTCGGIALEEIDLTTMQLKKMPGVYVAGEVLHVDGETGGFNFQAAWTTAWLAANGIAKSFGVE